MVSGYSSVAKVSLAMEQGEVDGQYNDWASTKARDLANIESGDWLVIGQLAEQPLKDLPNVPLLLDPGAYRGAATDPVALGIVVHQPVHTPLLLPPDVPADRAALLEGAFARTMADPEFLAEAEKSKLDIAPTSAASSSSSSPSTWPCPPSSRATGQGLAPGLEPAGPTSSSPRPG